LILKLLRKRDDLQLLLISDRLSGGSNRELNNDSKVV